MRIFHIASVADWEQAQRDGTYTTSTRGVTLEQEGFIHASRADQWRGVLDRFYADAEEPLLLLEIETDLLTAEVVEEVPAPGLSETFPHVYGPIVPDAVLRTIPLVAAAGVAAAPVSAPEPDPAPTPVAGDSAPEASFSRIYFQEMFHNLALASLVLVVVVLATLAGRAVDDDWGPVTGAALGLAVGIVVARRVGRRRTARRAS